MSTSDVPGYKPENRDKLAMGGWAEHNDGSLIFVESVEGGRVIYSVFDMAKEPVVEYRDAMAEGAFKKTYSWTAEKKAGKDDRWTWHDKSPFPWDRVIKAGARDGVRYASADDHLTAAERIRKSRQLPVQAVNVDEVKTRMPHTGNKASQILKRIQEALQGLPPDSME